MKSEVYLQLGGTTREDDAPTGDNIQGKSNIRGSFDMLSVTWKENVTGSLYSSGYEMWQRNMGLPICYV